MTELIGNIDQVTVAQRDVDQGLDVVLRVRQCHCAWWRAA
jgi:hypothetical protein